MKIYLYLSLFLALPCLAQSNLDQKAVPELANQAVDALPLQAGRSEIIIDVLADGRIKVEGIVVTQDELLKKLKMISDELGDQPVRIRGDRKARYGTIVDVLDLCQEAGISNISFASQSSGKKAEQNAVE